MFVAGQRKKGRSVNLSIRTIIKQVGQNSKLLETLIPSQQLNSIQFNHKEEQEEDLKLESIDRFSMASRRGLGFGFGFHSKPNYIYPASEETVRRPESSPDGLFEFDEADIWTSGPTPPSESRKIFPISKKLPKRSGPATAAEKAVKASSSLPVNIPDWSKILQNDQNNHRRREVAEEDFDDSDDDGDDIQRAPPHEYLARRRGDSFSVHEGIGRTLKGRDLRMVRNAIWKKTGFED